MHYTESRTIQQGKSLEGTAMSPNEHTAKTEYLSIGKVAKEKNISIKALRYYDEIGVFVPAYINPSTHYRYYTRKQLPLLDAVRLCLQLGIPLKTLPTYVKDNHFDFAALLEDTRQLAEEKIHGIQLALRLIEESSAPAVEGLTPLESLTLSQDEYLLAMPLSEDQLPPFDNYVLGLFIFARQHNMTLENPSCILYRFEDTSWEKYLCLKILPANKAVLHQALPAATDAGFALFQLPAGTYSRRVCSKSLETPSSAAISTFGQNPENLAFSLLERRLATESSFERLSLHTLRLTEATI